MAKKKQHGGPRPGSGRPVSPDGPAVIVSASVPSGLAEQLTAYMEREQCSRSEAVARAIRGLLGKPGLRRKTTPTAKN